MKRCAWMESKIGLAVLLAGIAGVVTALLGGGPTEFKVMLAAVSGIVIGQGATILYLDTRR